MTILRVALDLPSRELFEYRARPESNVSRGSLVLVPFGRGRAVGVVLELADTPTVDPARLRDCEAVIAALPPLPGNWLALIAFAARYYQRGEGESALQALPQSLRAVAQYRQDDDGQWSNPRLDRLLRPPVPKSRRKAMPTTGESEKKAIQPPPSADPDARLNPHQRAAVATIVDGLTAPGTPLLLHGITGSGKTEVYLAAARQALALGRQALLLVPEINLTPQLLGRVEAALPGRRIVALHSGLAELPRLRGWLAASAGEADIVLGTRLAVFTPMPRLGLIVVDEEHDASYKQQDGLRYSARDLAVWRGHQLRAPVVLGSATPSFESWANAEAGRYRRLDLPLRAKAGAELPQICIVGSARPTVPGQERRAPPRPANLPVALPSGASAVVAAEPDAPASTEATPADPAAPCGNALPANPPPAFAGSGATAAFRLLDETASGLSPDVQRALVECHASGRQSLVFLNRRGYAPVLSCPSCGWAASCQRCSAHLVWHKTDRRLHCHLCGLEQRVPRACPTCGNQDVRPFGRGTQRIEEALAELMPTARIVRIDADSTRRKGSAEALFEQVHAGEADVLLGTQMVAKGHDFQNVALVVALGADAALYSHDFRAPERLFQQLMQVAGRAGRAVQPADAGAAAPRARVLVQTSVPDHPLYAALVAHDYASFARAQLVERRTAGLPPYTHHAVLRAESRNLADAVGFLANARDCARALGDDSVGVFDPVPMSVVRIANVERAQLLVEAGTRARLQAFLPRWIAAFGGQQLVGRQSKAGTPAVRWHLEVDPIDI